MRVSRLIYWSTGLFLVSLFLPAFRHPHRTWDVTEGLTAALFVAAALFQDNPGTLELRPIVETHIVYAFATIGNLIVLFGPLLALFRSSGWPARIARTLMIPATIASAYVFWTVHDRWSWQVGYYVWVLTFVLATIGWFQTRKT